MVTNIDYFRQTTETPYFMNKKSQRNILNLVVYYLTFHLIIYCKVHSAKWKTLYLVIRERISLHLKILCRIPDCRHT
jgi:hypothetical protein